MTLAIYLKGKSQKMPLTNSLPWRGVNHDYMRCKLKDI
jgi:hypothetical protein